MWFCPRVFTLKQKAIVSESVQNTLKQSKTEPILQGVTSFKIIENQFLKKGNLHLNVTFYVVLSTGLYTQATRRSE
jgi:hypothetical protein